MTIIFSSSKQRPSMNPPQRRAGKRCRRAEEGKSHMLAVANSSSRCLATMMCLLLVVACNSPNCLSFSIPRQRTQLRQQPRGTLAAFARLPSTSLFLEASLNGSLEENVSSNSLKIVDDDESSIRSLAFNDVAESPAPPLNFDKYLTMQQKRVPVTIRYSTESGLKPYYLTVAKRVKDQYPDVIIDRIEVSGEEISGGETAEGETNAGTFEVLVDGKIVVQNNQRAGTHPGSIFVSMSEMDLAISRARKRRRPSTVYGENGVASADEQDTFVKSRLEFLKQRSRELQQNNNNAGSDGPE